MINIETFEQKAYFNIGSNEYYVGFHEPEKTWNGWAMPKFEKHIADLVANNVSTPSYEVCYYDIDDCYLVIEREDIRIVNVERIEKQTINTIDGEKEVYDFGSVGWTWDAYTIDEVKSKADAKIIENIEHEEPSIDMDY